MLGQAYLLGQLGGQRANPLAVGMNALKNSANAGMSLVKLLQEPTQFNDQQAQQKAVTAAQLLKNQYMPQQLNDQHQTALANLFGKQIQNQYLPDTLKARSALMQSQAQKNNFNLNNPLLNVAGNPIAQSAALNYIAKTNGMDSPEYQNALNAYNTQQQYITNKGKYYGSNVGLKNLPTNVKNSLILQGANVSGKAPSDETKAAAQDSFIKSTIPTQIQNQRYYSQTASNLYKDNMKYLPDASQYSGFAGTIDKYEDMLKSGAGGKPQAYTNFLTFKRNAKIIANEARRALGGQATDQETKLLDSVVNPGAFNLSPAQFISLYNSLGDVIANTENALVLRPSNLAKKMQEPISSISQSNESQKASGTVKIKAPNGKIYNVPFNEVKNALSNGGKRV